MRLVTPGTLTEEALLDAKARNYLTAVYCETPHEIGATAAEARLALASLDISTGEFEVAEVTALDLAGELIRLAPGEVLAPDRLLADQTFVADRRIRGRQGDADPVGAISTFKVGRARSEGVPRCCRPLRLRRVFARPSWRPSARF